MHPPRTWVEWETSQRMILAREVCHGRSHEPGWGGSARGGASARVWRDGARRRGQDVTPAQACGSGRAVAWGRAENRLTRTGVTAATLTGWKLAALLPDAGASHEPGHFVGQRQTVRLGRGVRRARSWLCRMGWHPRACRGHPLPGPGADPPKRAAAFWRVRQGEIAR